MTLGLRVADLVRQGGNLAAGEATTGQGWSGQMLAFPRLSAATVVVGAGLVGASIAGAALWARRRLVLVTVDGSSMEPTLSPGDRVLVHRRGLARVRRGDIVVLEPPLSPGVSRFGAAPTALDDRRWNIKRAVALPGDPVPPTVRNVDGAQRVPPGALVVFGDNVTSVDSRQRGFYAATDLLGVVVRRVSFA